VQIAVVNASRNGAPNLSRYLSGPLDKIKPERTFQGPQKYSM